MCGNTFVAEVGKPRLVALPEVLAMLERAHGEVSRICRERWDGKHGWKTTIPAEETDSDLLIGQALSAAAAFLERGLTVARDAPSDEGRKAAYLYAVQRGLPIVAADVEGILCAYLSASRQAEKGGA